MKIEDAINIASKRNKSKLNRLLQSEKSLKVGIFGGTFDPIHYAHLAVAEFIREKHNMDMMIFIPTGNPPHKVGIRTDKYDRYNMVLLAVENNENFIVSDIEVEREKPTYTIDTLKDLKKKYPSTDLYFITGADTICEVETWKDASENFRFATFIAATRPGTSVETADEKINRLKEKYNAKIIKTEVPSLDISSTYIRNQISKGNSVRYLISDDVYDYITENKIYEMEQE